MTPCNDKINAQPEKKLRSLRSLKNIGTIIKFENLQKYREYLDISQ